MDEICQVHDPVALLQRINLSLSIDTRLAGPQSRSELYGEENVSFLIGNRTPVVQLVS
jgi:hypothetical protein